MNSDSHGSGRADTLTQWPASCRRPDGCGSTVVLANVAAALAADLGVEAWRYRYRAQPLAALAWRAGAPCNTDQHFNNVTQRRRRDASGWAGAAGKRALKQTGNMQAARSCSRRRGGVTGGQGGQGGW